MSQNKKLVVYNSKKPLKTKDDTVKKLTDVLKCLDEFCIEPVIENIVTELYLQGIIPNITKDIILEVVENLNKSDKFYINQNNIIGKINDIYNGDGNKSRGVEDIESTLAKCYDKSFTAMYYDDIKSSLEPYVKHKTYKKALSPRKYVVLNEKNKTIDMEFRTQKISEAEIVINAYPVKMIIYDNKLDGNGRLFTIEWDSIISNHIFRTKKMTVKETEAYLEDGGFIVNPTRMKGILSSAISICVEYDLAEINDKIQNSGIYYIPETNKLKMFEYEAHEYELIDALQVIDKLMHYFKGAEDKLITVIKWGLMSCFNYATKQMGGEWMPWLYLFGKAGSGKTTLAKIVLYLYGGANADNDIGGSNFDTVARLGNRISQSTFPLVVNEPEGALKKPSIQAMIKSAIESTVARGKYRGQRYENIPSFNPVILTANQQLPSGDAINRRFIVLNFSYSERKTEQEMELFEDFFKINNSKNSRLNKLQGLSNFFIREIMSNPKLLEDNWKKTADEILRLAYYESSIELPDYAMKWCKSKTLEDLDDENIEDFRNYCIDLINQSYGHIQVVDGETGYKAVREEDNELKEAIDFKDKVYQVLNNKLIPFMGVKKNQKTDKEEVYFTTGVIKEIKELIPDITSLKSLSELIGGEFKVSKINGKSIRTCNMDFIKFVNFLYFVE